MHCNTYIICQFIPSVLISLMNTYDYDFFIYKKYESQNSCAKNS